MKPQDKELLTKLTLAAKKIIYDTERFQKFLKMLGSKNGAVVAVHTVVAILQKSAQIPPYLVPQLGVNIYLVMVELAQKATGHKADPKILHEVIQTIMQESPKASQPQSLPPQSNVPQAPPKGIIGQQMGVAA